MAASDDILETFSKIGRQASTKQEIASVIDTLESDEVAVLITYREDKDGYQLRMRRYHPNRDLPAPIFVGILRTAGAIAEHNLMNSGEHDKE